MQSRISRVGSQTSRLPSRLLPGALSILLVLSGCTSGTGARIFQRDQPPSIQIDTHVVSAGDTLYSIAWRYELSVQELANFNGISPPYTIYPGQQLVLSSPATGRVDASSSQSSRPQVLVIARPVENSSVQAGSNTAAQNRPTPATSSTPVRVIPAPTPSPANTSSSGSSGGQLPANVSSWRWPIVAPVVSIFGSNGGLQKGIMLATDEGAAVGAAADGQVVYSGSGLRGFGNLIILKHSDVYLSAYAHNKELLVSEGQFVRQGATIARAGKDLEGKERLYFEIRKDGKPVDPIGYLPRR